MFETEPLRSTPLPVPAPELVDMRGSPEGLPFQPSPIGQWPGEQLSVNFDASGWEYFRVWIVVRLLTLLTLGIYSPWAQLRLQRFLAQHTKVGCHAVEIQFQPSKLLFGRVIALMATLIGLGCAMFSPWAGATFIMFAFAAFPWLAVRSAAAKWRRVRLGGHRFGASPRSAPLMWAWWILGLATATSLMLQADFAIQMHFAWVLVWMVSIMAAGWVIGPLATSAVLHATLAQARLGLIPSVLHADVKEVAAVMFRSGLSKSFRWVAVLSFCASVGYTYFKDIRILELTSYAMAIVAIVVGVMGVSYARARRLNFVLNRLQFGGMRFVCEIDSDKLAWLNARWAFLALCTAGLSIPWGTVAWRGYVSAHVWVFVDGPWSQFGGAINSTANRTYNAADGLAESFDVELI